MSLMSMDQRSFFLCMHTREKSWMPNCTELLIIRGGVTEFWDKHISLHGKIPHLSEICLLFCHLGIPEVLTPWSTWKNSFSYCRGPIPGIQRATNSSPLEHVGSCSWGFQIPHWRKGHWVYVCGLLSSRRDESKNEWITQKEKTIGYMHISLKLHTSLPPSPSPPSFQEFYVRDGADLITRPLTLLLSSDIIIAQRLVFLLYVVPDNKSIEISKG